MDIQEFVRETLKQLVVGVAEAQQETFKYGATINPHQAQKLPGVAVSVAPKVIDVEFDVAVTIEERTAKGAGAEVGLGGVLKVVSSTKVEGKLESHTSTGSVSRVKFAVPVGLPPTQNK